MHKSLKFEGENKVDANKSCAGDTIVEEFALRANYSSISEILQGFDSRKLKQECR